MQKNPTVLLREKCSLFPWFVCKTLFISKWGKNFKSMKFLFCVCGFHFNLLGDPMAWGLFYHFTGAQVSWGKRVAAHVTHTWIWWRVYSLATRPAITIINFAINYSHHINCLITFKKKVSKIPNWVSIITNSFTFMFFPF